MKQFILFDNDGVLVETELWYFRANEKAMKELGVTLELEYYLELMKHGGNWWELAQEKGVTVEEINRARERRSRYYQHYLRSENIFIDGVEEVLSELSNDYRMGIVTTSRRVDFELIHHEKKLTRYMDFILCEEDYPRAKPHPDPYLKGLECFGAQAHEAIVVEDSQRGLTAAVSAGIECAVVKNDFTASHDFSAATYRIDSLKNLKALLNR
ncbi:MAG: HAD family hydrolase [Sulfuricurvum sp. GWF2_44_89]|uniref:phosphoglycolate phosphatase n=1 Tax=Sulfuricurvum kujiense TaxID=148813 RepID=A0A2D3WJY0_9BACT|nr:MULTISPECIES: HAD family phosphatase [Sulfuricurvum]OHD79387.1 MAG: HAD family hydrolase [Sulfuricurvum sp. GWF2_44_89]OHD94251.1 MAG: HAD family hydrolase [Sulfuricurvum sp. RIFOXYD12_FULL_44_77]OHD98543.1 MAG: HAD family hydrolase [Sulfuricurvum sp. RIFOXYD2_FULL_44_160]DAB37409.1 MAG TPA: HAD family hydrolase [Sulfuricurvum kujiense]